MKIHNNLISKIKQEKRNKGSGVYYENHHVTPDFMFKNRKRKGPKGHLPGDPNSKENKVLVTPREHYILHLLLYKIYEKTRYSYSCLLSLGLLSGELKTGCCEKLIKNRKEFLKSMNSHKIQKIRTKLSEAVSKHHKGKMVVKNSFTGEMIGQVEVNHPNVLSGEWVHHSKGNRQSVKQRELHSKNMKGLKNSNSKGYTDNDLLNSYLECCENFGFIVGNSIWIKYCKKYNKPYIESFKEFRFNGKGFIGLRNQTEGILNMKHDSKIHLRLTTKEKYRKACEKWL